MLEVPPAIPANAKPLVKTWKRPSTVIPFIMLGITLLLPMAMVSMAMLTVASNNRGRDLGGGSGLYLSENSDGIPYLEDKDDRNAGVAMAALLTGVCCPLVPYVLIMLILGTAYFAFRSVGS